MSYQLTITRHPAYLHAIVTGVNGRATVAGYLEELRNGCIARGCFRVLIEERLEGTRLDATDVFHIVVEESNRAGGRFEAIAYVDVNAEGDLMKFAETVAVNRFMPVVVFSSVRDAEQWLLKERPART